MSAAEIGLFPDWFCRACEQPTVGFALLARLYFDGGTEYYHNGQGRLTASDGQTYLGVSDPGGTRMVTIGEIQEPRAGVASAVDIELSGVDLDFVRQVYTSGTDWEGRSAEILIQLFDPTTFALIADPQVIFDGQMSVPKITRPRGDVRKVTMTIESTMWSSKAVAVWGTLSDADQKRRSAGDTVFQFVGQNMITRWPGPK